MSILRYALVGIVVLLAGTVTPAKANSITSISGELTVRPLYPNGHRSSPMTADSCSSSEAVAAYEVQNGPSGLLYMDCTRTRFGFGEDDGPVFFSFIDTSGSERCIGRMKQHWPAAVGSPDLLMEWTIDGALRGYECSTVGNTYIVDF